jgi:hypothetical protein
MRAMIIALMVTLLGSVAFAHENKGGYYQDGHGSSHKGGHYVNPRTGNHYQHRQ